MYRLFFVLALCGTTSLCAQAQTLTGIAQPGTNWSISWHGVPFYDETDSWGFGTDTLRLRALSDGCYLLPEYSGQVNYVAFTFPGGQYPYNPVLYDYLGSAQVAEIRVQLTPPSFSIYPGCDGVAGNNGGTRIWAGSPTTAVSVKTIWKNFYNHSQTGYMWHSLPTSQGQVIGNVQWAHTGTQVEWETTASKSRTLRMVFDNPNDVMYVGKRFGINNTVTHAALVEIQIHGLVAAHSAQTPTGISAVENLVTVGATFTTRGLFSQAYPVIAWVD